jgi:uncharacterized membrane protein HdeD (DUF308 family)
MNIMLALGLLGVVLALIFAYGCSRKNGAPIYLLFCLISFVAGLLCLYEYAASMGYASGGL